MSTDFNPYAPPAAQLLPAGPRFLNEDGLWREGNLLVMQKGAELPDRCLRCNAPAPGKRLKRTLSWHPGGWYLLVLFNLIIYLVVALCVRHTAKVAAPFCEMHRAKRRRAIAAGWIGSLGGIALAIFGGQAFGGSDSALGICIMLGLVVFLVSLIGGVIASQYLVPKRIDKHFVWLKKVSPEFLAPLPEWAPARDVPSPSGAAG